MAKRHFILAGMAVLFLTAGVLQAAPTVTLMLSYAGAPGTMTAGTPLTFKVNALFNPDGNDSRDLAQVVFSFVTNPNLTSVKYSFNTKNWRPSSANVSYDDPDLGAQSIAIFAADDGDGGQYTAGVGFGTTAGTDLQAIVRTIGKTPAFVVQPGETGNTPNPLVGGSVSPNIINADGSITIGTVVMTWNGVDTWLNLSPVAGNSWTTVENNIGGSGTLAPQPGTTMSTLGVHIPEPATVALLSIGGLVSLLRRNRK